MLEVVVMIWLSFGLFLDGFFLASFLGVVGDGCVFCGSLGFWLGFPG